MAISMFSSQVSPIAIDFGTSSIKLLQVGTGDDPPSLVAASQLDLPDAVRLDQTQRFDWLSEHLPAAIRKSRFKGKRVTCSIPSSKTFVQHLQVPNTGQMSGGEFINAQLHALTGLPPNNLVIRTVDVADVHRGDGGVKKETICFAVPRDVVMKQIELLKKCRLEVVGVHTEQHAIVWAFQHIHRRQNDDQITNLFVDLGWGSTKVGISHGGKLMFAKSIPIAGRHFDQLVADKLHCDLERARAHRLAHVDNFVPRRSRGGASTGGGASEESQQTGSAILDSGLARARAAGGGGGGGVETMPERRVGAQPSSLHLTGDGSPMSMPHGIDFGELVSSIKDELSMCLRYHRALFESRNIDRVIFLGGEARHIALCREIARHLNVPAMLGDPMARLQIDESSPFKDVLKGKTLPGWTVACGLCSGSEQ